MAASTTKAKRGGEWEKELKEGSNEVERLEAKRRARSSSTAVATQKALNEDLSNRLLAQYRRWDRSGGCAIGRMHVCSQR